MSTNDKNIQHFTAANMGFYYGADSMGLTFVILQSTVAVTCR